MDYANIKSMLTEESSSVEITDDQISEALGYFNTNDVDWYGDGRTNENIFIGLHNYPKCSEYRTTYNGKPTVVLVDKNGKIWAIRIGFKWVKGEKGNVKSVGEYYFSPSFDLDKAVERIKGDLEFYRSVVSKDPNFTKGT